MDALAWRFSWLSVYDPTWVVLVGKRVQRLVWGLSFLCSRFWPNFRLDSRSGGSWSSMDRMVWRRTGMVTGL